MKLAAGTSSSNPAIIRLNSQLVAVHTRYVVPAKRNMLPLTGKHRSDSPIREISPSWIGSKAQVIGLLAAAVLLLSGFLAYVAVPRPCTDSTRYIHATVFKGSGAPASSDKQPQQQQQQQPSSTGSTPQQQHAVQQHQAGWPANSTPCAAAPAPPPKPAIPTVQGVDLKWLGKLLPMTNFSSLRAADLLDAAIAADMDHRAMRELMQLQNKLFCAANMHLEPLPGSTGVPFGNVSVFVYDNNDIVSGHLKGAGHDWEAVETQEMLWALRQFQDTRKVQLDLAAGSAAAAAAAAMQGGAVAALPVEVPDVPLVVDIGANVGWFTLNAAAAQAKVAAFEAMGSNVALLRRSMCTSPWLEERIALYATGLGPESTSCYIMSGTGNVGDGFTICDATPELAWQRANSTPGYEVRGEIAVRRLDSLLAEDVQLMKMDVEGFERKVLEGATGLLTKHNVWYIMVECNVGLIGEQGGKDFIKFLDALGYATSPHGFRGPFWSEADVQSGAAACTNINLFCVKKSLPH